MADLSFATFIQDLQEMGVYDYFLPFLLIFAITYALLENSHILGTNKKNVNVVVSMVIGLILIVQQPVVATINSFLQKSSLIIIVILVALLVIFLVSGSSQIKSGMGLGIIVIIIVIALIWALSPEVGWNIPLWSGISDKTRNFILMLVVFMIIPLILITRKSSSGNLIEKAVKGLGDWVGRQGEK